VAYFLYTEVFSLDSKTVRFNKAVDRIKEDPQCIEMLGSANEIIAYGEPTYNKWAMARPIAYDLLSFLRREI
jgi:import inner membrane translocase subunit TIM21